MELVLTQTASSSATYTITVTDVKHYPNTHITREKLPLYFVFTRALDSVKFKS